jgi:hypothetical protein
MVAPHEARMAPGALPMTLVSGLTGSCERRNGMFDMSVLVLFQKWLIGWQREFGVPRAIDIADPLKV